jgi:hypothetical protein
VGKANKSAPKRGLPLLGKGNEYGCFAAQDYGLGAAVRKDLCEPLRFYLLLLSNRTTKETWQSYCAPNNGTPDYSIIFAAKFNFPLANPFSN